MSFIRSAALLMSYYLVFLFLLPVGLRRMMNVPGEITRKVQHVAFSLSIFLLLELFPHWIHALAAMGLLLVIAYPVLSLIERSHWYQESLFDRNDSGSELRKQLLLVQLSFGVLLGSLWGLGQGRYAYLAAAAVMAWGLGDAAAALAGHRFGQLRIRCRFLSSKKSYEGFGAMVFWSGLGILLTLWLYGGLSLMVSILCAVIAAPLCATVELATGKGLDTLTVPWTGAAALLVIVLILQAGGLLT